MIFKKVNLTIGYNRLIGETIIIWWQETALNAEWPHKFDYDL